MRDVVLAVVVTLIVLGGGYALAQQGGSNIPVIRTFSAESTNDQGVQIHRFEDGPNTCYVLYTAHYQGQSAGISCVVRTK